MIKDEISKQEQKFIKDRLLMTSEPSKVLITRCRQLLLRLKELQEMRRLHKTIGD